jgi:myo-inositol-1(or 4)-monophosphatase
LRVARFEAPNVWDVAGGLPLVRATGGVVLENKGEGWQAFDRFEAIRHEEAALADLRHWRRPLLIGQSEAVGLLADAG